MKKNNKMRWVAAILSLFMILGLVNYVMSSASESPDTSVVGEDITTFVDLKVSDFFIQDKADSDKKFYLYKDGVLQPVSGDEYKLKKDGLVAIAYSWGVKTENIDKVKNGNYFMIQLPDQSLLRSSKGEYPVLNKDGKEMGRFYVGEGTGKVKVVFTGIEAGTSILKDGKIGVYASVKDINMTQLNIIPKSETSEAVSIPVEVFKQGVVTVGDSGDQGIFNNPTYHNPLNSVSTFRKEAAQLPGTNQIQFTFRVNYDEIRKIYVNRAEGDEPLGKPAYLKKKNIYFVDEEMPEDLTISSKSLETTVYYWAPMLDKVTGKVIKTLSNQTVDSSSTKIVGDKLMFGDKVFFTVVEKNGPANGWEAFRDEIIARNPERIIGIYNSNKFVVTVGDMPFDDILYGDAYNKSEKLYGDIKNGKEYLDKHLFDYHGEVGRGAKRITAEQIAYMKNAYSGKPVVDFVLRVRATPKGIAQDSYRNVAVMNWENHEPVESKASVKMVGGFGSVAMEKFANKYSVSKEWKGAKKESVKVYLLADGVRKDEVILNEGNHWAHDFLHLPENNTDGSKIKYSVEEEAVAGYRTVVEPVLGKYASIIKNYEQRDISFTKKWLDEKGEVLSNPEVEKVSFFLHKATEANPTEENALYMVVLKKDSWKETFTVDKTDDLGNEIVYKVSEKVVDGFNQVGEAEGNMTEGFVITNQKEKKAEEAPTLITASNIVTPPAVETVIISTEIPSITIPEVVSSETVIPTVPTEPIVSVEPDNSEAVSSANEAIAEINNFPPISNYPILPVVITSNDRERDERENIISNVEKVITDEIPQLPSLEDDEEGDEMDLDILGDNIPRGDTTISPENTDSKPSKKEVVKEKEDELNLDKDKTPKGAGKVLALTGGLQTVFLPIFGMLLVLFIAFLAVQFMIKKGR